MTRKIFVSFGILFIMLLAFSSIGLAVAPVHSNESPSDDGTLWELSGATWNLTLTDIDSTFNWSIDTSPDVGNSSGFESANGSKSCSLSGLLYSTTYRVYVNATSNASAEWTNASYNFTTRPAKLRENSALNGVEQAIVGVVGIVIILGLLYLIMKTDYKKDGTLAKLLVGIIIALALLMALFSAL